MTAAITPWWRGAVIYQIYPRSFLDTNGDGIGDLAGVIKGLDHIARLGCDGVWLSPFFTSPMADFGYDISDYRGVDPVFGTLADFDEVIARAHALGLKVIIDQVYSHTSDQHPWFAESRRSRDNKKAGWYVWADAKTDEKISNDAPPNNWISVFGGSAWQWDSARKQFYLHNFLSEQPDLNFHNPAVQDAILEVAQFWLERGVDGFRLDVINYYTHDARLRDNPPAVSNAPAGQDHSTQKHKFSCSRPENFAFIGRLRALANGYDDICLLGEIFDDEPLARQIDYTDGETRLHTAYSFHLLDADKATPALFAEATAAWNHAAGWLSWSLGNHDVVRFPTRLFGNHPTTQQIKLALAALFCLRGTIFIFQGDELGLPQAHVTPDRMRDPHSQRNLEGAGRDGARTPFPWRAEAKNAGFSQSDETWLPVDPTHMSMALDTQQDDRHSIYGFVKQLIALRRRYPALSIGGASVLDGPDNLALIQRQGIAGDENILCAFNFSENEAIITPPPHAILIDCGLGGAIDNKQLILPGFCGAWLRHA